MNPDTPINDEWIDDIKIPGQPDSGKGKTFAHHVLLADGRETYTYYRYGTNEQVGSPEQSINKDQKSAYDDAVKKATPPGGRPEINVNGQRKGWDPKTGDYTVDLGPVPTAPRAVEPGQVQGVPNDPTIQEQQSDGSWVTKPNPNYRPPAGATATKDINGVTYERQADGTWTPAKGLPSDPQAAKPKYVQVKQDEATGKWFGLTPQGTWEPTEGGPGLAPTKPEPPHYGHDEGGDYTITTGPDGQPVKTYAKTTGAPTAGEPPGAPPPDYSAGNVAKNLTDYSTWLNQQVMDGKVDQPTATRLMASRRALAETAVSEQANATRTATDIYGHQVSERNTDVNASTTRNSTAVGGVNTAFQLVQGGAAAQPKGSDAAYRAFQGLLQTQLQQSQAMGGMNQPPPVPIPAAAQPYMTITSPGGTKVDLHDTAGGTPPAPGVGGTPAIPSRPDVQGPTSGPMPGSVSAESAAAPAGQIPAALAAHADSKPTGNAFADTEMTLTAAGISPAAIAAARERFLAAQTQSAPDAVQTFSQGFQMPALAGA